MQKIEDGTMCEHLGDGVYAAFDGYGIELRANSHDKPTDRIYIEPSVLRNLLGFAERAANQMESNQ